MQFVLFIFRLGDTPQTHRGHTTDVGNQFLIHWRDWKNRSSSAHFGIDWFKWVCGKRRNKGFVIASPKTHWWIEKASLTSRRNLLGWSLKPQCHSMSMLYQFNYLLINVSTFSKNDFSYEDFNTVYVDMFDLFQPICLKNNLTCAWFSYSHKQLRQDKTAGTVRNFSALHYYFREEYFELL